MTEQIIEQIKDDLGIDEFWKSDTEDELEKAVIQLEKACIDREAIIDVICRVWQTAAEEYGG